jgi:integrating conjugative element protein (TIGR03749 family)
MTTLLTVGLAALTLVVAGAAHAQTSAATATPDATAVSPDTPPSEAPAKPIKSPRKVHSVERETSGSIHAGGANLETTLPLAPASVPGVEHVRFERRPVVAVVEVGRERLVHFPYEVAIHEPEPTERGLSVQIIGRTAYLKASAPMPRLRLVAEGLDGQGTIPVDVVVRDRAPDVPDELEILVAGAKPAQDDEGDASEGESTSPDLVQLSRYCAQRLYAPQRLVKPLAGVRAIDVRSMPVAGLYRGGAVVTTPIGAWRSRTLFVTAVRFTNRTGQSVELDMEQLRGQWLAATPQHWRLLPQGSEADTTAVCLVSEQPFDAARP